MGLWNVKKSKTGNCWQIWVSNLQTVRILDVSEDWSEHGWQYNCVGSRTIMNAGIHVCADSDLTPVLRLCACVTDVQLQRATHAGGVA